MCIRDRRNGNSSRRRWCETHAWWRASNATRRVGRHAIERRGSGVGRRARERASTVSESAKSRLPDRFSGSSKAKTGMPKDLRTDIRFRAEAHEKPPPCPDRPHCSSTHATPWVPRSKKSRTSFLPLRTSTKPPPRNPATPRYARLDRAPIERRARNRSRAAIAVTGRRVHAQPDCLPVLPQSRSLTRIPRIPSYRTGR